MKKPGNFTPSLFHKNIKDKGGGRFYWKCWKKEPSKKESKGFSWERMMKPSEHLYHRKNFQEITYLVKFRISRILTIILMNSIKVVVILLWESFPTPTEKTNRIFGCGKAFYK